MAGKTLSEQIYDELYHDITRQQLRCGQKLTLNMLKERFHVSHTPIREALMRLAENGLVTYYSNCGVTVIEFEERDIQEVYQFASEMDALAIQFCSASLNHMPLVLDLQEIIENGNAALAEGDISRWKEFSERFHVIFYRHAQNYYLDQAAARLRARLELLSCMYYKEENVSKINEGHNVIYKLVCDGKYTAAASRMRRHLQTDMAYAMKAYSLYQRQE